MAGGVCTPADVKSGLLLGVSDASPADGASILQGSDNGTLDRPTGCSCQRWTLTKVG